MIGWGPVWGQCSKLNRLDMYMTEFMNEISGRVVVADSLFNCNPVNPYHSKQFAICTLHFKGKFSYQLNQSLRYVHSCLEAIFPIPMSTNNPSQKSVVLESSAKPSPL